METLHPDLDRYAYDGMVRHPLLRTSLTKDVSHVNLVYLHKKNELAKAKASGDWKKYVFLYERPYRLDALLKAAKNGLRENPSQFWALVGHVWIDTENAGQHPIKWRRLWAEPIEGRRTCMSEEDLDILHGLPEQIEVWRGISHKRGLAGLSWTLDREEAVRFARRFCLHSRVPLLARGIVEKRDVLAYFGERGEREIISMKVSISSVTKLSADRSYSAESISGGEAVMVAAR